MRISRRMGWWGEDFAKQLGSISPLRSERKAVPTRDFDVHARWWNRFAFQPTAFTYKVNKHMGCHQLLAYIDLCQLLI
jgi:hypothetical protein